MDPCAANNSKEERRRRPGVGISRLPSEMMEETDSRRLLKDPPVYTPQAHTKQLHHWDIDSSGTLHPTHCGCAFIAYKRNLDNNNTPCHMVRLDRRAVACLICSRSQACRPSSSDDVSNMASYTPSPGASRPSTRHPVVDHLQTYKQDQ